MKLAVNFTFICNYRTKTALQTRSQSIDKPIAVASSKPQTTKPALNLDLYTPKSYKDIQEFESNATKLTSSPASSATNKKFETRPTQIDSARIEKNKKIVQKPPLSASSGVKLSTKVAKIPEATTPVVKQLSREISYDVLSESMQTTTTNLTSLTANEFAMNDQTSSNLTSQTASTITPKSSNKNNLNLRLEINSSRIDLVEKPSSAKSVGQPSPAPRSNNSNHV